MGVKGLLQCLQSITQPVSFDRYNGLTVAVDAMSWLHKEVFAGDVRLMAREQWEETGDIIITGITHGNAERTSCEDQSYDTSNVARKLNFKTPLSEKCSRQQATEKN